MILKVSEGHCSFPMLPLSALAECDEAEVLVRTSHPSPSTSSVNLALSFILTMAEPFSIVAGAIVIDCIPANYPMLLMLLLKDEALVYAMTTDLFLRS